MFEKLTQQQRLILAVVVSVVFFVTYELIMSALGIVQKPKPLTPSVTTTTQAPQSIASKTPNQPTPVAISTPVASTATTSIISKISSKKFDILIDKEGRVSQMTLDESKFKDEKGEKQKLLSDLYAKPLEIRFVDQKLNDEVKTTPYTANSALLELDKGQKELILTQKLSRVTVTKTVQFAQDGSFKLHISMSSDEPYFITPGFRPDAVKDTMTFKGVLLKTADEKIKKLSDSDVKEQENFQNISVVAGVDRYYTSLLYDTQAKALTVGVIAEAKEAPVPFISGKKDMSLGGYIGPKYVDTMKSIDPQLSDVVEYGFITFMARPVYYLLDEMQKLVGNWGWAIVIFTIFTRIVLFPLTYKGMVSMARLKELAPKMKEIKEKYKGDMQKTNIHMMELYKKHGANPMGGCLPLILQIPIFFAIYRVLLNSIELKGAEWIFWINDLSLMDPYFILPILMGASMYFHQKLTPTSFQDPMQEKIFKYLPIVFTFFFVSFPAGLTLYWFVNNLLSIAQQVIVNKLMAKHHAPKVEHT